MATQHGRALANPYHDLFLELQGQSPELMLALRKKLIWAFSWAVPCPEAIEALVDAGPLVEIGAGTGYWAWLVAQAGGSVVAYDLEPRQAPCWYPIEKGDATSARVDDERALLLCWPPYGESLAIEALEQYRGRRLIYIGEFRGRTADARFHDLVESAFALERRIAIPTWPGYRDEMFVFSR